MSAVAEARRAMVTALRSDNAVLALCSGRVFDGRAPAGAGYPFVSFGPVDASEADAECLRQWDIAQQIDVWTQSQGASLECNQLAAAVEAALHEAALVLADPYALQDIRVVATRFMDDPEPGVVHGVVSLRALVGQAAT